MPVYQLYISLDGSETATFPGDNDPGGLLSTDTNGNPMVLEAEFWARGWPSARVASDAIRDAVWLDLHRRGGR